MTSVNLSAATKLKHLEFRRARQNVQWVTTTLQTVESEDLQLITLWPSPETLAPANTEPLLQQWRDLDRLLVQFWVSHSIRPKVAYQAMVGGKDLRDSVSSLLPELTRRGPVDPAEHNRQPGPWNYHGYCTRGGNLAFCTCFPVTVPVLGA